MPLKLQIEAEWENGYRVYSKSRGIATYRLLGLVRLGAQAAGQIKRTPFSEGDKQSRIQNILKKINRILRSGSFQDATKANPEKTEAIVNWHKGYAQFQIGNFSNSWDYFSKANTKLFQSPLFLLDYGRLAYNTGWYDIAQRTFSDALDLIEWIPETLKPLQVYRWLAKVSRITGDYNAEVFYLESLLGNVEQMEHDSRHEIREDRKISLDMVERRIGRAYVDAQNPNAAWEYIKSVKMKRLSPEVQVIVAEQGISALTALNQNEEGERYARRWSKKLGTPNLFALYLKLIDRPFSARRAYLEYSESEAKKIRRSNKINMVFINDSQRAGELSAISERANIQIKFAQSAFQNGLYIEGQEIAFRAASQILDEHEPLPLGYLFQLLNSAKDTLSHPESLEDLFNEALQKFSGDYFIRLQYSYFLIESKKYEEAIHSFLQLINDIVPPLELQNDRAPECFLALAYAKSGDEEKARNLWRELLPKVGMISAPQCYSVAVQWAVESNHEKLAINWTEEFLLGGGSATWTTIAARPIFESAGRAALVIGENQLAAELYERLVTNHAHHISDNLDNIDTQAIKAQAQPLLMAGIAHALNNDVEKALARLELAKTIDRGNELISVAEAVLALKEGDSAEAAKVLLHDSPPDWLLSTLGPVVALATEERGTSEELASKLRIKIAEASQTKVTYGDLYSQNLKLNYSLEDAKRETVAALHAYEGLQTTFEEIIEDVISENEKLKSLTAESRTKIIKLEDILKAERPDVPTTKADGEQIERFKGLFPNIHFKRDTLESIYTLSQQNFKSVARTLGILQYAPSQISFRKNVVNLGEKGTVFEVGFPGKGKDDGRVYVSGGGTRWSVELIGYKSSQKKDIEKLRRTS